MAEQEPLFGTLPPWMKFTASVGIPSAIAVFLVWSLVTTQDRKIDALAEILRTHAAMTVRGVTQIEEQRAEQRALIGLLRRICLHTAKDLRQAETCGQ